MAMIYERDGCQITLWTTAAERDKARAAGLDLDSDKRSVSVRRAALMTFIRTGRLPSVPNNVLLRPRWPAGFHPEAVVLPSFPDPMAGVRHAIKEQEAARNVFAEYLSAMGVAFNDESRTWACGCRERGHPCDRHAAAVSEYEPDVVYTARKRVERMKKRPTPRAKRPETTTNKLADLASEVERKPPKTTYYVDGAKRVERPLKVGDVVPGKGRVSDFEPDGRAIFARADGTPSAATTPARLVTNGEYLHTCWTCEKDFRLADDLREHIGSQHGGSAIYSLAFAGPYPKTLS